MSYRAICAALAEKLAFNSETRNVAVWGILSDYKTLLDRFRKAWLVSADRSREADTERSLLQEGALALSF